MKRTLALVAALLACSFSPASAAVLLTAQQVANPPATLFTVDTAYNSGVLGDTWTSYVLGLSSNDGAKISAVDVSLSGTFNQRWAFNVDTELFDPTPSSINKLNGDTHLTPFPTSTIALAPKENNNQTGAFPTALDTPARDYGLGTTIGGAWGYIAADQSEHIDFAYIVIPKGNGHQTFLNVRIATNPDQTPSLIEINGDLCSLAGVACPAPQPLVVTDALIDNVQAGDPDPAKNPVMHTFTANDNPHDPTTWSNFAFGSYTPAFGGNGTGPALSATFDPLTQKFSWNTTGSPRGIYTWNVTAANSFQSDQGTLTIHVTVPEPGGLALAVAACFACLGAHSTRRR